MTAHALQSLNDLVPNLAPRLKDHLWQSTVFAGIAALLTLALRRNQARTRFWLWLAASLKFLVPFSLLVTLGSHLAPRHRAAPAQPALYYAIAEVSQPFTPLAIEPAPLAPSPTKASPLPAILASIWLTGVAAVLTLWLVYWSRIRTAIRQATPLTEGRELDILRCLEAAASTRTPIQLLLTPINLGPGIYGIVRPKLIWPAGISRRLSDAHLQAILAHELAHVRRRDNLTAALHMLVQTVFWFHPFVWAIGARLEAERERACDEAVLALTTQPFTYAESILKVCELSIASPLPCVSGVTGADLKRRLTDILEKHATLKLTPVKITLLTAVAVAAITVPILLGQATPTSPNRQKPSAAPPSQQASPSIAFDVVSVKQSKSVARFNVQSDADGDSMVLTNVSPRLLIGLAFAVPLHDEIANAPAWTDNEAYDITAKVAEADLPTFHRFGPEERNAMLQRVVIDRFQLKFHFENRALPVYELVIAKGGPHVTEVKPSISALGNRDAGSIFGGRGDLNGRCIPMPIAARALSMELGRPVLDKTALTGNYNFSLQWTPDDGASPDSGTGPSIFTAIEEQLGLKLQPAKDPIPILVVDSITHPDVQNPGQSSVLPAPTVPSLVSVSFKPSPQPPAAPAPRPAVPDPPPPATTYPVSTVKLSQGGPGQAHVTNGLMEVNNMPLRTIIRIAYALPESQVRGGPSWLDTTLFTIYAKSEDAVSASTQGLTDAQQKAYFAKLMLPAQRLLADRFQLKAHTEEQQVPIFALVVAKGGPKFKPSTDTSSFAQLGYPNMAANTQAGVRGINRSELAGIKASIDDLTRTLGNFARKDLDRPIVNHTGLAGKYDFKLQWTPADADQVSPDAQIPTIFTAIEEQLGLKLDPQKGPLEILVIDHVEMPSEN